MISLLLIDNDSAHAARVDAILTQRGHAVNRVADIGEAIERLQAHARAWDIVMLVIGDDHSRPWFTVLHNLQEAAWRGAMPEVPLFLCVSKEYLGADFELRIERLGARYVSEE
jgi:CheY-like chemotaxis protein